MDHTDVLDIAKLKERREKLGLTQTAAAKLAGLPSPQRWNDVESGRKINITMETLARIAQALKVSPKSLLKG